MSDRKTPAPARTWPLAAIAILGLGGAAACTPDLGVDEDTVIPDRTNGQGGGFVDAGGGAEVADDGAPIGADAMPPIDACVADTWASLLENGGFDGGSTDPWVLSAGNEDPIVSNPPSFEPHMGSARLAIFRNGNVKQQHLRQVVAIPETADALRISGYRCFVTGGSTASNTVDVMVADGGGPMATFKQFSNLDGSGVCNWSEFTFTAEGDFADKELTFSFEVDYGSGTASTFLFDSLTLEARVCGS